MKFSRASLYLLLIQLAIVSTVAGKYLYQRWSCPRVWTRAVAFDPHLVMRGRYLSARLIVDACGHMPPAEPGIILDRRNDFGDVGDEIYPYPVPFPAKLGVGKDKLTAVRLAKSEPDSVMIFVDHMKKGACDSLQLEQPVDFYIPEHASDPSHTQPGQELWIEVTIPPKGPPRPLQLALKEADGSWKPLAIQ
jgi:hypothetical protein